MSGFHLSECDLTGSTKSGFSTSFFRSLLSPRRDVPAERLYNRQYKGDYISGFGIRYNLSMSCIATSFL